MQMLPINQLKHRIESLALEKATLKREIKWLKRSLNNQVLNPQK
jgi:regulator of replication initiation timing